ncbi:MAG: hypothetical protein JG775_210 [Defluviitaleaceae bacterium]|jgi:hypothetical protein|uniref:DUF3221 domain-containing protein n=2 Tax=Defluviitalea raffinosedens TaxID=1450156 RepID=A0A7C8HG09_9FIRM|nr:DUF3221 domain-containing protein [Defluviitalea raffinosedens]MBZ4667058.1 hypothetical protein [Defluviitaleaceae bacterium]
MRGIIKKMFCLPVILLMCIGLTGCGETSKKKLSSLTHFEAIVIKNGENFVVVPNENSNEARISDQIAVRTNNASIMGINNQVIRIDEIPVGHVVEITYNGEIMESYPAQVFADKIQLYAMSPIIEAYLKIIEEIYQEDPGLNQDISIIALDTTDIKNLNDWEKQILLVNMEQKYGKEVMESTFEELMNEGLIDKENRAFPEGILITITNPNFNENKDTLTYEIKKWRSGTGAVGYTGIAYYDNGTWIIEKKNMWIS